MNRPTLLGLAALISTLTACNPSTPARDACTDYRIMTFTEFDPLGWTDVVTRKVCVLFERPTTKESTPP